MSPENGIVAVIGNGGREHALVEAYAKSSKVSKVLVFPGNDFMTHPQKPVISFSTLATTGVKDIVTACLSHNVVLVDVAQDNAVAAGVANATREAGIVTVGPSKEAGQIEWDKAWSRQLMQRAGILQPEFHVFDSPDKGKAFLTEHPWKKWFVKASGLAAGKGAIAAKDPQQGYDAIDTLQQYGKTYLVEEWLEGDDGTAGEEFSAFAYSDGRTWQLVGYAQDHKRAFDNDEGPNTGGMGCVSHPRIVDKNINRQIRSNFEKIFKQLQAENRPYQGVLYFGGMVVKRNNKPTVYAIECNARWGDPEAEVLVPGIKNDFFDLNMAVAQGRLNEVKIQTDRKTRVSVVGAAHGYPEDYFQAKGTQITGLEDIAKLPGVRVFGAGLRRTSENKLVANGGRLFHVVGEGQNVLSARKRVYDAIRRVTWIGFFRSDIGWKDMQRLDSR